MNRKIFFVILGILLIPGIDILSRSSTKRDYLSPCEPYYHLKNGYDLYSEVINDSILRFILRKGDLKRVISSEPYLTGTNEKYNLHYNNRDFDDYVALTRSEGNYIRIVHLYQKSSGKNLFANKRFLEVCYDMDNNILIYLNDNSNENPAGNLTLLFLDDLTVLDIDIGLFAKGKQLINYYYTAFSIEDITRDYITIAYTAEDTAEDTVVHTLKRISKRNRLIIK